MNEEQVEQLLQMREQLKDYPDRLVCHPGVYEELDSRRFPDPPHQVVGLLNGFGIQIHTDPAYKENEWKLFRGEKWLVHCFPNPFKEGEMIIMKRPDFGDSVVRLTR